MNDNDRFNIHGKVEYPGPIEEIFCRHPEISQAYVSNKEIWLIV